MRIAIDSANLQDPQALVATLAHELCHVHLISDGRIDPDRPDHEPLTDLLTVFLGFGIFNANTAVQFKQFEDGVMQGWSSSRQGYLPEEAFGYALALYTWVRREP